MGVMKLWVEPDQVGMFMSGLFLAVLSDRVARAMADSDLDDPLDAIEPAVRELITCFPEPLAGQLGTQIASIVEAVRESLESTRPA